MAYKDLRKWIAELEKNKQLVRINEEVDGKYEMGCLIRRIYDIPGGGVAVLFENIKGNQHTQGKKYFAASLSSYKRIALAMDLPIDTPYPDLIQEYRKRIKNPIPAILVKGGACKEVVEEGDKVNLKEFPVPYFHPLDGGPYMGTFHTVITKDPESGRLNMGMYRMMLHDEKNLGTYILPFQHWAKHFEKYRKLNRKMPVAVCFGQAQTNLLTAFSPLEHPPDEFAYSGGLAGEPVRLVKCETADLEVPEDAEIVLEGEIDFNPETFREEGPFGEYYGYLYGRSSPKPVLNVKCVTHRKDPIMQGTLEGRSVPGANEDHHGMSIVLAANIYDILESHGVEVTGVSLPLGAQGYNHIVIGIRQKYQGESMRVASIIWSTKMGLLCYKHVVVVDEDIDVYNPAMVEFAISSRVNASEDIKIFDGFPGSPLDPRIPPEEKAPWMGMGKWARMLIDATRPFHWEPRELWDGRKFPPVQAWPKEIEDLVESKWEKYGLGNYIIPLRWNNTY
jgi:4-hydroxy-3-polyprenylbenzoate decarboxylase